MFPVVGPSDPCTSADRDRPEDRMGRFGRPEAANRSHATEEDAVDFHTDADHPAPQGAAVRSRRPGRQRDQVRQPQRS
ncbi:hypothetical protein AB0M32_42490 [Streptomyces sp. NPDC051985]|uniref:hypothetical protein n=1 Tax=Streptomyces sp. NPDC051985 TaxID=3155807 RepID=UPI00341B6334